MASIIKNISNWVSRLILSVQKGNTTREIDPEDVIAKEIDTLVQMIRERNEGLHSEEECREMIIDSFDRVRTRFSNELLDSVHTWPRYVKTAANCVDEPIQTLINYVDEHNYKKMTKSVTNLVYSKGLCNDPIVRNRVEKFAKAVYLHIVETIDPEDCPACLALGKAAQKEGDYSTAAQWYDRITKTEDSFNGITSLLSCYEEETKKILAAGKQSPIVNSELWGKVNELNSKSCALYEKWCNVMEECIESGEVTDKFKREYVDLMAGFARFERSRGNYDKSLELLKRIPDNYPDIYRVYCEEAMLYQFKPYKNKYYSLVKAVKAFRKAEDAINTSKENGTANAKSEKSILMPLANTLFKIGKYEEAVSICHRILMIDNTEKRATDLLNRISKMAS